MEGKEPGRAAEARKEEATSSETLAEIEDTQKINATTGGAADASNPDAAPAPDGTPEPARGSSADGREAGEPM